MDALYAVIVEERQLLLATEHIAPDRLAPQEILVEAETSVISAGTELAIYTAIAPGVRSPGSWNAYPFRPGYGVVGRVRALGSEVMHLQEGDRVLCFGSHASQQILNVCGDTPRQAAFLIGEDLSAETAVMLRMALIAFAAPLAAQGEAGDTVCVLGLGVVGNLAAQLFQRAGMRVIALDVVPQRCDLARQVGIETALAVDPGDQVEAIRGLTGGKGVAIAVDAVGDSRVVASCIQVCAPFGQVILLGSPRVAVQGNLTDSFRTIHNNWLTVKGALEWRLPPYPALGTKHSIQSVVNSLTDRVRARHLVVDPLITHRIQPDQLPEAYEGLLSSKGDYMGVVVDWRAGRP